MASVDEQSNDDRDPLLVRPFVLQEDDGRAGTASDATWQAEPEREMPTQLLPAVPVAAPVATRRRESSRRPVLLIGAGVAAVLAVAGYTVLRPALQPAVSTTLPGQGLPVVTRPAPPASVPPASNPAGAGNGGDARDADATGGAGDGATEDGGEATASTAGTTAATPAATATSPIPAGTPSTVAASRTATAAPVPPAELVPSPLMGSNGTLVSGNGLCLDLQGGEAQEGREVHVDDCNGTSPQRWRLTGDRTLEVLDMCAYLVGDGGVELTDCDRRTTAQWRHADGGRLINAANGLCLTDPHFGGRPANQVIVATCTGDGNQRWTFR